jgi:hypothetical protein
MIILCVVLFLIISLLLYKLYQFSLLILEFENSVEDCLEELNERYISISKILEKEIFFDSVEVRQVVNDIKLSQESVVKVANILTKNMVYNEIEEKNTEE